MASLKTKDIKRSLNQKGFSVDESRDHIWLNYMSPDGKKTRIRTKVSHGKESIGDPLIAAMAKQTQLKKDDFIKFVNCSLSKEDYYNIVKSMI